jgi:UDP-3-O-[3-hydroxymyristoyl] glucosamine N-acyltransferase
MISFRRVNSDEFHRALGRIVMNKESTSTSTFNNEDGSKEDAYLWINPDGSVGGWVALSAKVDPTAYVHPEAIVEPGAKVGPGVVVDKNHIMFAGEDKPRLVGPAVRIS